MDTIPMPGFRLDASSREEVAPPLRAADPPTVHRPQFINPAELRQAILAAVDGAP